MGFYTSAFFQPKNKAIAVLYPIEARSYQHRIRLLTGKPTKRRATAPLDAKTAGAWPFHACFSKIYFKNSRLSAKNACRRPARRLCRREIESACVPPARTIPRGIYMPRFL
jgi:hypothetical protein